MIIAIGGRIASGKNTVCDIIQDLCKNNNGPDFEQKAFAGKLKQTASLLTGIPVEMFEDQEFKQKYMSEEWNNPDPVIYENGNKAWMPMTYREFLQKLGTEAMRDGLHTNIWINALFADYHPISNKNLDQAFAEQLVFGETEVHYTLPNWIITDMRFPNEMQAVKERGGVTIRVVRPKPREMFLMNATSVIDTRIPEHPSETALDDAEFDYEIINDGSIEDLVEKVKEILIKENIL